MANKFICPRCGGGTRIEKRGTQTALICREHGNWIKWLSKAEVKEFESQLSDENMYLVSFVIDRIGLRPEKLFRTEQMAIDWVASQDYPQDFDITPMEVE